MSSWDDETKPAYRNYHIHYKAPIEDIGALEKALCSIGNHKNWKFSQILTEVFLAGVDTLSTDDSIESVIFTALRQARVHESEMKALYTLMTLNSPEFEIICEEIGIDPEEFKDSHMFPKKDTWWSRAREFLYHEVPVEGITTNEIRTLAEQAKIIPVGDKARWGALKNVASQENFSGGERGIWKPPPETIG